MYECACERACVVLHTHAHPSTLLGWRPPCFWFLVSQTFFLGSFPSEQPLSFFQPGVISATFNTFFFFFLRLLHPGGISKTIGLAKAAY